MERVEKDFGEKQAISVTTTQNLVRKIQKIDIIIFSSHDLARQQKVWRMTCYQPPKYIKEKCIY